MQLQFWSFSELVLHMFGGGGGIRVKRGVKIGTDMIGRPGARMMEVLGRSAASYLARTPCVPVFLLVLLGLAAKRFLDFQERRGITSVVPWFLARSYSVSTRIVRNYLKMGKGKTNKHRQFWQDTPWCVSRLSGTCPVICPVCPADIQPLEFEFTTQIGPNVPGAPGTSRIYLWDASVAFRPPNSFMWFFSIGFFLHREGPSHHTRTGWAFAQLSPQQDRGSCGKSWQVWDEGRLWLGISQL